MKEYIIIISTIIIYFVIIMFALRVMIKSFKEHLKSRRIFVTALLIVLLSTAATYFIALFFKKFDIVEQVGSADAWINFAGAGMSGIITMLALYFTLKSNQETNKANQMASLRPYIVCNITNLDKEKNKIIIENYIDNYDFIECKMKNISNNIANGIKIIDEFSSVQIEENKYKKFDDLFDLFGISIYTVSISDGTFLAPQEEYNWKTNFCIELNEDGTYKWNDSAFNFKHTIVFQFTDIANFQTYIHKFEFEININVDIYNDLHFFLWNISNSVDIDNQRTEDK